MNHISQPVVWILSCLAAVVAEGEPGLAAHAVPLPRNEHGTRWVISLRHVLSRCNGKNNNVKGDVSIKICHASLVLCN